MWIYQLLVLVFKDTKLVKMVQDFIKKFLKNLPFNKIQSLFSKVEKNITKHLSYEHWASKSEEYIRQWVADRVKSERLAEALSEGDILQKLRSKFNFSVEKKVNEMYHRLVDKDLTNFLMSKIRDIKGPNTAEYEKVPEWKKMHLNFQKYFSNGTSNKETCYFTALGHSDNVLEYGEFVMTDFNKQLGDLSIRFITKNKGGVFTGLHPLYKYPKIKYNVWYAMKTARLTVPYVRKNGKKIPKENYPYLWGAMHLFWKMVLRSYYKTPIGKERKELTSLKIKSTMLMDKLQNSSANKDEYVELSKKFWDLRNEIQAKEWKLDE